LATRASEARSSEVHARAEASFRKEERAKDGAKAMMEYQATGRAVREKIARLKALRLAKEAADSEQELAAKGLATKELAAKKLAPKARQKKR
jgi:hypothetical protein